MPAVEDGILPPGKNGGTFGTLFLSRDVFGCAAFSAGLEARLYVSQDG
ncbi:MAG: hypothetical protein ABI042_16975 [Verrucomicrobiota bacterium]